MEENRNKRFMTVVYHREKAIVEGIEIEIGRDPRHMTVEEFNALGHSARPLLQAIRSKCKDCCGGYEAEVRRCADKSCDLWPFRMGTNPFRTRELTEEQRSAASERLKVARQKMPICAANPNAIKIAGATITVSKQQRAAVALVIQTPAKWSTVNIKTRHHVVSRGWIIVDGGGIPVLTETGKTIASTLGIQ